MIHFGDWKNAISTVGLGKNLSQKGRLNKESIVDMDKQVQYILDIRYRKMTHSSLCERACMSNSQSIYWSHSLPGLKDGRDRSGGAVSPDTEPQLQVAAVVLARLARSPEQNSQNNH